MHPTRNHLSLMIICLLFGGMATAQQDVEVLRYVDNTMAEYIEGGLTHKQVTISSAANRILATRAIPPSAVIVMRSRQLIPSEKDPSRFIYRTTNTWSLPKPTAATDAGSFLRLRESFSLQLVNDSIVVSGYESTDLTKETAALAAAEIERNTQIMNRQKSGRPDRVMAAISIMHVAHPIADTDQMMAMLRLLAKEGLTPDSSYPELTTMRFYCQVLAQSHLLDGDQEATSFINTYLEESR